MARLPVAALLVVAACQRAPARIYTDAEIADLEARVMAKVAETDASCSHPELLAFATSLDADCRKACRALENSRRPFSPMLEESVDTNEVAALDEKCAANTLAALGRAAMVSPGCSPYQVGVHAEPGDNIGKDQPSFIDSVYVTNLLLRHALREVDAYVAITELLIGIRVYQDFGRGRINLIQSNLGSAMEGMVIAAAEKILSRASLTNEQLDDVAATLDVAIENEPWPGETLQGEAVHLALHHGVAALKPKDWQPPGGRSDLTSSNEGPKSSAHDSRDDAAQMMAAGLRMAAQYAQQCPASASLAACFANLKRSDDDVQTYEWDIEATNKHAIRVAIFPDDDTRHDSQQQLVKSMATQGPYIATTVQRRAVQLARLIGLRVHVQVLRDGRCPSDAQLAEPPYSVLRTPAVLGDSFLLSVKADSLVVDVPGWVRDVELWNKMPHESPWQAKPERRIEPVRIPCP
jgi:hypothetical protein